MLLIVAPTTVAARVLESLHLDAYASQTGTNGPPVVSRTRLDPGVLYVATVQGTVSFYAAIDYVDPQRPFLRLCGTPEPAPLFNSAGGIGQVGEDPQFIFAYPSAQPCGPRLPHVWSNFQTNVGAGWRHPLLVAAHPVTRPSPDHLYDYGLVGRGQPVGFRLVDSDTRDDYGTLEISLRRATASDCVGSGYEAFGLRSATACQRMASGPEAPRSPRVHALTLQQSPLLRVLRNRDVPSATNQQLASGALDAQQFAAIVAPQSSISHTLSPASFSSGAVSEFHGGGLPDLISTAALYRTGSSARAGLGSELAFAQSQVPTGATVSVITAPASGTPDVVTFTPQVPSGLGGDELLGRAGQFVYSLSALEAPDRVLLATQEALLSRLVSRSVAGDDRTRAYPPLRVSP